ncbi:MAG: hypothetical protein KatS3mg077_2461 [Candidatus Binatia bacterium]|nr:MAG: hypothetical protein KatS3mg077_2461 [Candidatus Binatia bacterium]
MAAIDVGIVIALMTTVVMGLMILAFYLMRDTDAGPDRRFALQLVCPVRKEPARVEVVEEHKSGIALRSIRWCSLRAMGERCCEQCVWRLPSRA